MSYNNLSFEYTIICNLKAEEDCGRENVCAPKIKGYAPAIADIWGRGGGLRRLIQISFHKFQFAIYLFQSEYFDILEYILTILGHFFTSVTILGML